MNEANARGNEVALFAALNAAVEPFVRAGLFAPLPPWLPLGLIVLEHTGRRSGRLYRTPLLAYALGPTLLVSTVRGARSQWTRKLAAAGAAHVWLNGRRISVHARALPTAATGGLTIALLTPVALEARSSGVGP